MSQEKQFFNDDEVINNEEELTPNNTTENKEPEEIYNSDTIYFAEDDNSENNNENNGDLHEDPQNKKPKKSISIKSFVIAAIAIVLATVMLTYSICNSIFQSMYAQAYVDAYNIANGNENGSENSNNSTYSSLAIAEFDLISQIISNLEYHEIDKDKMMTAAIRAYIEQTGDKYAEYYTEEELEALNNDSTGKMVGVGVTIINDVLTYNGVEEWGLTTVRIIKNSPAEEKGLQIGDFLYRIYIDDKIYNVKDVGYDEALNLLLGEVGTTVKFEVLRKNGDSYKSIIFEATRKELITESVYYHIATDLDPSGKIGVVAIEEFDYTTPTQFTNAIDTLKSQGCDKFVIDVRNNLGGYEDSIHAVLSYFLNEGDVFVRTKDNKGNVTDQKITPTTEYTGDFAGCNVKKEDIGKYKDLNVVVLCNELTISAAELFVATFKDYKLGTVIGTQTYGKGTMQKTFDLKLYGLYLFGTTEFKGAIKITTGAYMSAFSDNYDGIGVEPDIKQELILTEEEENMYTTYTLPDTLDDQLVEAIKHFKTN